MFTPDLFRTKAAEYFELARSAASHDEARKLLLRAESLTTLADNEQWLSNHYEQTVHARETDDGTKTVSGIPDVQPGDEERILRCLGAALILQWDTLPAKLQRELFDNAGAMGDLVETASLRGSIARFLFDRRDNASGAANPGREFPLAPSATPPGGITQ